MTEVEFNPATGLPQNRAFGLRVPRIPNQEIRAFKRRYRGILTPVALQNTLVS